MSRIAPGRPLAEVDTPALVIDAAAFERNIARMQALAERAGIAYRPHAKAHKSPVIARLQLDAGAGGVCCAKLGEAEVMAAAGIDDILITTPVVGRAKLMRLAEIARGRRIAAVADDAGNIAEMAACARACGVEIDVVVEVDVGQGRCGVAPGEAAALARAVADAEGLRFRGLQGYQGAIQMTASFAARKQAAAEALEKLRAGAAAVRAAGIDVEVLTGGGSGTSAIDAAQGGLTEIQPGGYIFMDSRYAAIEWADGGRIPFAPSLSVLAAVISRPAPGRAIVDMGYKAVSSDGGPPVPLDLPGAEFAFAGEEHGELRWPAAPCPLALGDKVAFRPSHCDTTVNLYDRFVVVREGVVEAVWDIAARGRSD